MAIFRDAGDAMPQGLTRRPLIDRLIRHDQTSACRPGEAGDKIGNRGLAIAGHAGKTDDLAATQGQIDPLQPG